MKYKLPKKYKLPGSKTLSLIFNEHIHLGPNQLFRGLLDVWKHD